MYDPTNGRYRYLQLKNDLSHRKYSDAGNGLEKVTIVTKSSTELPHGSYGALLFRPEWQQKRNAILNRDNKCCVICANGDSLQVHHRQYHCDYDFLEESASEEIRVMRDDFSIFKINELRSERALLLSEKKMRLFTFNGTKINRAVQLLLKLSGIESILDDGSSSFTLTANAEALNKAIANLEVTSQDIDQYLKQTIEEGSAVLDSKWGYLLPADYQVKLIRQKYYDIDAAIDFFSSLRLVANSRK